MRQARLLSSSHDSLRCKSVRPGAGSSGHTDARHVLANRITHSSLVLVRQGDTKTYIELDIRFAMSCQPFLGFKQSLLQVE